MVNINATLIAQILNFLVLVFVLAKFVYKPVLGIMEERKNKIASDLETAEMAKKDAEAVKAQAIIENARQTAQAAHDKIMADTKVEQEQYVAAQKEIIATEKKKAMDEVRAQVISLSMIAAGKIVEQKLNSEEDKKMASKIVDSIMK